MLAGRNVPTKVLTKKIRMIAGQLRPRGGIDDAEQDDPSVGHQRAIREDEQDRDADRPPARSVASDVEHGARLAVPEKVGRQPGGDGQRGQEVVKSLTPLGPSHGTDGRLRRGPRSQTGSQGSVAGRGELLTQRFLSVMPDARAVELHECAVVGPEERVHLLPGSSWWCPRLRPTSRRTPRGPSRRPLSQPT